MKFLKWTLAGLCFLVLLAVFILLLSIPIGKWNSTSPITDIGKNLSGYVLQSVHVVNIESDSNIKRQHIYVSDGQIVAIESDSLDLREGYEVISEYEGQYVMPGLVDMHAHVFDRTDLTQYLSYGVTTVRNMMGFPMHLRWKSQLSEGDLIGSRMITASPTMNQGSNSGPFHKKLSDTASTEVLARKYAELGYDFFKVYNGVDADNLDAIQRIAKEYKMDIAGHPPAVGLDGLLHSDLVSIEHVEELLQFLDEDMSSESMDVLVNRLSASGKYVVITLSAYHRIYQTVMNGPEYFDQLKRKDVSPVIRFMGDKQLSRFTKAGPKYTAYTEKKYQAMKQLTLKLEEGGVPLLFGTDAGPNLTAPGRTVLEEIQLLKQAGLTNQQILYSATAEAGECLKTPLGRLEKGYISDMVVTSVNPLIEIESLDDPLAVFQGGLWLDETYLMRTREEGEGKQSFYTTLGLFLESLIN